MPAVRVSPNEGEQRILLEILDGGTVRENWTMVLFKSDYTPTETDTVASFTPVTSADFPSYTDRTLTRTVSGSTWSTPASGAPTDGWTSEASAAESTYNASAPQAWTNDGAAPVTIYGYFIKGANSNKVIHAERLASPRTLEVTDILEIIPRVGNT